jgi:NitT/TauT family transport system substrate-binding protein
VSSTDHRRRASRRASLQGIAALAALGAVAPQGLRAQEVTEVRIAQQFGLPYLPLIVARNLKLIEAEARSLGLPALSVTWARLGGGAAANDALLSSSVDIVAAGTAPLLLIWDRTRGNADVRAIASLDASAAVLTTRNPAIKSLRDFTERDRIAVPAVKVSLQAVLLQIAAEKEFGAGQYEKLDRFTVGLPHPEATTALLSGKTEITDHFTTQPFIAQQIESGTVRPVVSSNEILGGPATNTNVYTTARFRNANPRVVRAVFNGLARAVEVIQKDPEQAARIFIEEEQSKLPPEFVVKLLRDPLTRYSLAPLNTAKYADFLHRTGTLKSKPASWRDYFFPEAHSLAGS